MQQPLEEPGSPQRWIFFLLIAGLIAITILFVISRIFEYSGPKLLNSHYSVKTGMQNVSIGSARFVVPENTIRHPGQRGKKSLKQLDLIFLWPSLDGFSLDNQVAFSDATKSSRLIFATLSQPEEPISSSERLYSVYSQYFVGDPIEGPADLIGFAMDKTSGFKGETIYFKPDQNEPFVARCIKPVKGSPTFCLRDISLNNNVQLSYRFRLHLLKEWHSLDDAVRTKIQNFQLN